MIAALLGFFREFWWMGIFSLVAFFLTLLALPIVIIRLPVDYFTTEKTNGFIKRQNKFLRITLLIFKNIAGFFLLLVGFIMLFIPGQGILTIIAGLSVMNFPGKRKLEIKLASREKVMKGLNWIRDKGQRPHFHSVGQMVR